MLTNGQKGDVIMKIKNFKVLIRLVCAALIMTGCSTPKVGEKSTDTVADVLVVGGGGAGLVAALTAAEEGSKVILLEKLGYLGGATMLSAGIIPATGTHFQEVEGVEDNPEAMARDILRPGNYSQNAELVRTVAEGSEEIVSWLEGHGVKWNLLTSSLYKGQVNYRMHQAEGKGAEITDILISKIKENQNIEVYLETPGTGLITDDSGKLIGVTAKGKDGKDLEFKAKSVILATSGFAANEEMLKEYLPQVTGSYPMVAPGATGEGILWGQELGARVENMKAYQGYAPISNETKKSLGSTFLNSGGILINKNTERFTDEYLGYSELSAHIVNQPEHIAYMIFDSNVVLANSVDNLKEDGILIMGDTPEELAQKLGLDSQKLIKEFNNYKEGISKGEDLFNRTNLPEQWEGPFYGVEVTGDLRHTQGGLVVDMDARVIKNDGEIIPGLYGAGGVTEGFSSSGGPAYMSGNGLLQALVFGRVAGKQAAVYK